MAVHPYRHKKCSIVPHRFVKLHCFKIQNTLYYCPSPPRQQPSSKFLGNRKLVHCLSVRYSCKLTEYLSLAPWSTCFFQHFYCNLRMVDDGHSRSWLESVGYCESIGGYLAEPKTQRFKNKYPSLSSP